MLQLTGAPTGQLKLRMVADARWIVDQAAGRSRPFWTGMEYRFMPPAVAFITTIHAGRVGQLRMLSIREHRFPFLPKVGDWNRFARNTGGTMVEKCCHLFDLMRVTVGSEPVRVYCSGAMDVNHQDERYDGQKPDIIDNGFTTIDFADAVRGDGAVQVSAQYGLRAVAMGVAAKISAREHRVVEMDEIDGWPYTPPI